MTSGPEEARVKVRKLREALAKEATESIVAELDTLDEFSHYASTWHAGFFQIAMLGEQPMENPADSRRVALAALFPEALLITMEIATMLRAGLVRPAMASLRKLYETQIDARFIELDLTGSVALRWMHWEVAHRAKLRPDDDTARKEYECKRRR